MRDLVQQLRDEGSDAMRKHLSMGMWALCGRAGAEIERLRSERDEARRTLWLVVHSNGGYTLEKADAEEYPGDQRAHIEQRTDPDGAIVLRAITSQDKAEGK